MKIVDVSFQLLWERFVAVLALPLFLFSAPPFAMYTSSIHSAGQSLFCALGVSCLPPRYLTQEIAVLVIHIWAGSAVLSPCTFCANKEPEASLASLGLCCFPELQVDAVE